jgi:hypothetical protein
MYRFRIHPIDPPQYSMDLAPSDFYLFGKFNGTLAEQKFSSTKQLLLAIREITNSIGRDELKSVFDAWEHRLSQCIQIDGDYITSGASKFWTKIEHLIAKQRC